MNKPEKQKLDYYDWSSCEDYLWKKHPDKNWNEVRNYLLEINYAGNDVYIKHWPDPLDDETPEEERKFIEELEILTQEFGERNEEDGEIYCDPIVFHIYW